MEEPHRTLTARIAGSARRAVTTVGDLLDFTRSRLGGGIPVVRTEINLGKVVHDVVDEVVAAHPDAVIRVDSRGDHSGRWDGARLSQALGNLIGNAVQHGGAGTPVTVDVSGDATEAVIAVHNRGPVIPADQLDGIFNPMKARQTLRAAAACGPTGSLGLELYSAERIVSAHGGHVAVESSEAAGTTFTVRLPRDGRPPAG